MEVNIIQWPQDQDWIKIKNAALTTVGEHSDNVPSSSIKRKYFASEHSPIRGLNYIWEWVDIEYWVSVHIVRHKIGIEHYVRSQRNDRQSSYDRRQAPQSAPVTHKCIANAQAIINISHKRLCKKASKETIFAWETFLEKLRIVSPELYDFCVPSCIYRNGICPEVFGPCGYNMTKDFHTKMEEYTSLFS